MIVRTRYDIHQNVGIIALNNHPAIIESIIIDGKNVFYEVGYWDEKDLKVCQVHEFEISENINEVV